MQIVTSCAGGRDNADNMPRPCKLTFDLLTKSGVRVTCDVGYLCADFVFLGLSILNLGPCTGQTDVRQTSDAHHRLMPPPYRGGGIIIFIYTKLLSFYTVS